MDKTYKSGKKVLESGIAEIVGPRGGHTGVERTVVKDEPFPPTLQPGQKYIMKKITKTK